MYSVSLHYRRKAAVTLNISTSTKGKLCKHLICQVNSMLAQELIQGRNSFNWYVIVEQEAVARSLAHLFNIPNLRLVLSVRTCQSRLHQLTHSLTHSLTYSQRTGGMVRYLFVAYWPQGSTVPALTENVYYFNDILEGKLNLQLL